MSSQQNQWLYLYSRSSRVLKIFLSLCLLISMSFIVWSWNQLNKPKVLRCPEPDSNKDQALGNDRLIPVNEEEPVTEETNDLFSQRKALLSNYCDKINNSRILRQDGIFSTYKLAASRRRHNWIFVKKDNWYMEWCPVYKAASSPWMAVLATISKILTPHKEQLIRTGKLSFIQLFKEARLTIPSSWKSLNGPKKIRKYQMVIVRHPFARLLSAYRDKLEQRGTNREYYHRKYGYRILTQFRYANFFEQLRKDHGSNVETFRAMMFKFLQLRNGGLAPGNHTVFKLFNQKILPPPEYPERPTFSEFVQYLIQADSRTMDEHWRPMYLDCSPCNSQFDLLVKVESMDRDRSRIFDLLGIPVNDTEVQAVWTRWANHGRPLNQRKVVVTTGQSLGPVETSYFSEVPQRHLILLYDKYEQDFKFFNYTPTKYWEVAAA